LKAMHDYESKYGRFPASASYDNKGKKLLSWRVLLLPFLGEEKLYKEFKLDEPWDSAHNKKLIARMPAVYRPADAKLAGQFRTTYLAPVGKDLVFEGTTGLRVADIGDGARSTIMLVDADDDRAVVWTRPDDLAYDPKQPARGLAARHNGRFLVGLADGST